MFSESCRRQRADEDCELRMQPESCLPKTRSFDSAVEICLRAVQIGPIQIVKQCGLGDGSAWRQRESEISEPSPTDRLGNFLGSCNAKRGLLAHCMKTRYYVTINNHQAPENQRTSG